ncbi:esterase EstC domain protein [Burkholderia mallei]|nr:esterase EstC domain protein [Burkholderia pseudomallei A79D]KGX94929.1 esterase EstC domain protein [Burkholderia pseudomallei A79C]KOT18786.1 esterase EstC domain protein [Burkholderia mallei]KOT22423.1 esterase EstC domain protein [Burkholderia mallei]
MHFTPSPHQTVNFHGIDNPRNSIDAGRGRAAPFGRYGHGARSNATAPRFLTKMAQARIATRHSNHDR